MPNRVLLLSSVLLVALPALAASTPMVDRSTVVPIQEIPKPVSFLPPNSLLLSAGGVVGSDLHSFKGGTASVGFQFRHLALDLRGSLGSMNYGSISVLPGSSDVDTAGVTALPDSELNRARRDSDSWAFMLVEPGVSVTGQLFATVLPRLAERARFGLGVGSFNDQLNGLDFLAVVASFEADLEYQLIPSSGWALRLGGAWETGVLKRKDDVGAVAGRLPVSWVQFSLSLLYAL